MLKVQPIPPGPTDSPSRLAAQSLFRQYAHFLRTAEACAGTFNFPRFEEETRTLPTPYTAHNGELLLATIEDVPAACIAYRAAASDPSGTPASARTAEIKRLFVHPDFRGQGLARKLVAETLTRAAARTFTRVILDTDLHTMPEAFALYRSFGFHEYAPRQGTLAYLDRPIP